MLERGPGEDVENMFGDVVFLENSRRCEKDASDVERDISVAYEGEMGDLVEGWRRWVGWMSGVPVHERQCGHTMSGGRDVGMERRARAPGCEQEMGVVVQERRERDRPRVRYRGWLAADVDVAKEPEARVSGGLVELVRAVLGRRERGRPRRRRTYLDFWMVWRNPVADESVWCPKTVEYMHPQRRRGRVRARRERQQPRGHVECRWPAADDGELGRW